jgi:hypothetical protein
MPKLHSGDYPNHQNDEPHDFKERRHLNGNVLSYADGRAAEALAKDLAAKGVGTPSEYEQFLPEARSHIFWGNYDDDLKRQDWKHIEDYDYVNQDSKLLYQVRRYHLAHFPKKKKFIIRHQDADNLWVKGEGPVRVPYRLPELLQRRGEPVVLCEGEKAVNRALEAGLRATCAHGQKWTDEVTAFLAGEEVIILPDNDSAGEKNTEKALEWLSKVGAKLKVLKLPGLKPRADLYDWLEAGGNKDQLYALAAQTHAVGVRATPAQWIAPETIPARRWLYRPCYIRQFVSVFVGPGGSSKTSVMIAEALAMMTGRSLLGVTPERRLKVWYWNGEDPLEEMQRRVAAAAKHYKITEEEIGDRLFLDSGLTTPIVIAAEDKRRGLKVDETALDQMIGTIRDNGIDVVVIDPFVTVHRVNENDNMAVETVVNALKRVAQETNCAVMIVHHSRKVANGGEKTVDDARGATALIAAARSARVINTMTSAEARTAGIDERERRKHFRIDLGKSNMTAPPERADWILLQSVGLNNTPKDVAWEVAEEDFVGVATPWTYPVAEPPRVNQFEIKRVLTKLQEGGPWREDPRSKKEPWVGIPIAEVLDKNINIEADKRVIKGLIKDWLVSGILKIETSKDTYSKTKSYVVAGSLPELDGGP